MPIAEQGKLKSMFKADQGSMRLPFPGWLQKFLLEMDFFLQVQFFHFAREKNNFMMSGAIYKFYENVIETEKSKGKGRRGGGRERRRDKKRRRERKQRRERSKRKKRRNRENGEIKRKRKKKRGGGRQASCVSCCCEFQQGLG